MDITERDYQPSLLFVKACDWYKQQNPERSFHQNDLTIFVYRKDDVGAYKLSGPKMFWTREPMSSQYFYGIDQDDMFKNADQLGEVVLWDRLYKKTILIGKTFAEAIEKIS